MTEPARPSLRLSVAVALGAGLAFVVVAALLVPWHWLPGGHVHAVPATDVFSAEQIERGEHVSGLLRHAAWGNILISVLVGASSGSPASGARSWLGCPVGGGRRWWSVALCSSRSAH